MQWGSSARQIAKAAFYLIYNLYLNVLFDVSKRYVQGVSVGGGGSECLRVHLSICIWIWPYLTRGNKARVPAPATAWGQGWRHIVSSVTRFVFIFYHLHCYWSPGISTSRYFTTNGHKHFLKIHFQRIHINCQKHHWDSGFLMMLPLTCCTAIRVLISITQISTPSEIQTLLNISRSRTYFHAENHN